MSQTKMLRNRLKSVFFRLCNCRAQRAAFTAKFCSSATSTGIFRWRFLTKMSGAVILSVAKDLRLFLPSNRKQQSEMFRFAQHAMGYAGGLSSD
jgi:hypothetical protein